METALLLPSSHPPLQAEIDLAAAPGAWPASRVQQQRRLQQIQQQQQAQAQAGAAAGGWGLAHFPGGASRLGLGPVPSLPGSIARGGGLVGRGPGSVPGSASSFPFPTLGSSSVGEASIVL